MPTTTLADKVIVVTGSARGAGRSIALAVAAEGARVVIADRTDKPFMLPGTIFTVADEVREAGGAALPFQVDLRDEAQIVVLRDAVEAEFGTVDGIVNNAGIQFMSPVVDLPVERWDQVMSVNARATFLVCKHLLPPMLAKGFGSIVNISSIAGRGPMPGMSPYAAAKAAIDYFTLALAEEVRAQNIAVNSLAPTWQIDTEGIRHLYRDQPEQLRRAEPAEHYAKVVVWLLRQDASTYTGNLAWSRQLAAQQGICREWCCAPRGPVVGGPSRVPWELGLPIARDRTTDVSPDVADAARRFVGEGYGGQ